eukprot:4010488-Pleurochrysis_carterae.AAC.1
MDLAFRTQVCGQQKCIRITTRPCLSPVRSQNIASSLSQSSRETKSTNDFALLLPLQTAASSERNRAKNTSWLLLGHISLSNPSS